MRAAGLLFMSNTKPLATTALDGTFALTLLAFDRIGPHRVEPWRITYTGPRAREWAASHSSALVAGQPIRVELDHLRNFTNGSRSGGPEFVCNVISIELAPTAHKKQEKPATCQA